MENTWFCQFQQLPKSLTVGDILFLNCEGSLKKSFNQESLQIEFLNPEEKYSLVLLDVLKQEEGFLSLKVTSYQTGLFQKTFYISDGKESVKVENVSFEVQSLLTDKDKQAQGPFGPFLSYSSYMIFFIFFILCFISGLSVFFYRFFKRTRFVKKIFKRKSYLNPSKAFVLKLRKDSDSLKDLFENLEEGFKTFLEDRFLIPVSHQKDKKILKLLKRYHPFVYKESKFSIKQVLNEFALMDKSNLDYKSYLKLKKICQNLVFSLEDKI
ncbi:MAG: hypothetical protein GDA46_04975 [Bdellovibrionales bacterium]|nr:hypothetical protein [Bdellovibrionales bacterium]